MLLISFHVPVAPLLTVHLINFSFQELNICFILFSLILIPFHFLFEFSPSDLDADLEDNQDYDSTVSQSETNPSQKKLDAQSSASSLLNAESPAAAAASDQDQMYKTLTKSDVQAQEAALLRDGSYCSSVFTAEPEANGCPGEKGDGTSDVVRDRGSADVCAVLEQVRTYKDSAD